MSQRHYAKPARIRFFGIRYAYRIHSHILKYEGIAYGSRSSFVSQYRIAKAAFATSSPARRAAARPSHPPRRRGEIYLALDGAAKW